MFTLLDLFLNDNELAIQFKSKEKFGKLKLELRLKDEERFFIFAYTEVFEVEAKLKNNLYEANISLTDIVKYFNFTGKDIKTILLNVEANGKYYDLICDERLQNIVKEIGNIPLNQFAGLEMAIKKNKALIFNISMKNIKSILNEIKIDKNMLYLNVSSYFGNPKKTMLINSLSLKKRVFKNTLIYKESISLERVDENKFSLDLQAINDFSFEDQVSILDFIVEVKQDNVSLESDIKMTKDIPLDTSFKVCDFYKMKCYWTKAKGLSIRVDKQFDSIEVETAEVKDQILKIHFGTKQKNSDLVLRELKCGVYRQTLLSNDLELIHYKDIDIDYEGAKISLNIKINELFGDVKSNNHQTYQILFNSGSKYYKISMEEKFNFTTSLEFSSIYFDISDKGLIKLSGLNKRPVKLGVLGTCFTRSAFNSKENYFNPDYKLYFDVKYSHFWPSVISLMGQPIPFNKDDYKDVTDKELDKIKKEYEKTSLRELEASNVDYVIIDFYVDAIHGVKKFSDGKVIGPNPTLNQTSYSRNVLMQITEQFDFRHSDFWDEWKKSCNQLIDLLDSIIGLNKVILNVGGLTKYFSDENREKRSFIEDKGFTNKQINFYNNTWEKMNNYFITNAPNVNILDMGKFNYISDIKHTIGMGPHHFESNYYKSFIGELAKIVVLNEKRK